MRETLRIQRLALTLETNLSREKGYRNREFQDLNMGAVKDGTEIAEGKAALEKRECTT